MIVFKDVTKTYPGKNQVQALRGINLTIPAGQIFGIMGKSGAGKSTLLRCINMLERPDSGEVWVDGTLMNSLRGRELRRARKQMGMVFQHFNLLDSRTVFGNIAFPLELAGLSKERIGQKVEELADLVGLSSKLGAYPAQLSGGEKQRVGIARALATDPKVLLCDEPTSALDPNTTSAVLNLLQTINERFQLTIVLITHELTVIQEICHGVAVLEEGTLQETGRVLEVFTKPQSPAAQGMLEHYLPVQSPNYRAQGDGILVRLTFLAEKAHQPIISKLIRRCEVDVNILSGRIDRMKDTPFGRLLVEISGSPQQQAAALDYLREHQVEVEVVGQ